MAIHDKINNAKKIQLEMSVLKEQFSQLVTPALSDTQNLAEIYQLILNQPGIDKRDIRHYFVVIAVYLYSPISLFGKFPIRAGLCQEMGEIIGCCRQNVSETFSQAKFRYENIQSFRKQLEAMFEQIILDDLVIPAR